MRVITEQEVAAAVTLPAVVDSIQDVLGHQVATTAWNVDKTMATWAASSAHGLGAVDTQDGLVVFKTWVNTPAGASAMLTAFAADDGHVRAVMEAGTLGALRTAAIAGLATRLLSDPTADEIAVLGAGHQALRQVAAAAAVRPLRRVRVWSRSAERRDALADRVRTELRLDAVSSSTVVDATRDAPLVTAITRATEPFLEMDHLADGAHLNALGAILPSHAEFNPSLLASSALTVVDSEANARRASREFTEYFGDDWSAVHTLADVVAGTVSRPARPRCTVFKAMGMGLSDLAVARLVLNGFTTGSPQGGPR
ncbi:MAG: ornithine cyclodeaminase family protein [Pseudonocardiaceae bacterium]|nr:ornithine cyclodeaminase family protein [Pseudonocardiaceae bacterium]